MQYMEQFPFKKQDIIELTKEATLCVSSQPIVIQDIKTPVKVFGNIHGNFIDLMRFFDIWKSPCELGDIENFAYIFLGNFVDRGKFSLETICLLMALKIRYSDHIFLIRGNHEDPNVNRYLGFGQECKERLGEDINQPGSVFNCINNFFENLPLAAVISDSKGASKVFCCHGGIGPTTMKIDDIKSLKRPLKVSFDQATADQQKVVELLWSDPVEDEEERGILPNPIRDPSGQLQALKRFGPDMVDKFLKTNNIQLLIRSHQFSMKGEDRFAQERLMTVSSCTDYCGVTGNAAGFLTLQKKLIISPKIIQPAANSKSSWRDPAISEAADVPAHLRRAPTPPRRTV